jgi:spore germination protein KC
MFRRIVIIFLIIELLLLITGCWGKTELNEIGIVTATGVDLEPNGDIRITVLSVQPEGVIVTAGFRSSTWIGSAVGKDLLDAGKNLRGVAVKRLSWLHNKLIIIGHDVAVSKMKDVIDFLTRNREIRLSSYIIVAEGRAFDLLQAPADIQRDLPTEILGTVRNTDEWSKTYVANTREFLMSYAEHCGDIVTGRITAKKESMLTFSAPKEEYEKFTLIGDKIPIVFIDGCALFKGGEMLGWLDPDQTKGYLWITGKLKPGSVITLGEGKTLAMEDAASSTKVTMDVDGNNITALVKVDVRGTLVEQTDNENIRSENTIKKVENDFNDAIKAEMEDAVKKIQKEYNTDVFLFGSLLNKQNPDEWKKVEKDWENCAFSKVKVEYDVKTTIERTGKILREIF